MTFQCWVISPAAHPSGGLLRSPILRPLLVGVPHSRMFCRGAVCILGISAVHTAEPSLLLPSWPGSLLFPLYFSDLCLLSSAHGSSALAASGRTRIKQPAHQTILDLTRVSTPHPSPYLLPRGERTTDENNHDVDKMELDSVQL